MDLVGIFTSLFHVVSAFNNAGFSLWSDSLMGYVGDPVVNIIITFLFIVGGIGFTVISDLMMTRKYHQLSLHTKLMIIGTLSINIIATIVIFLLEYTNSETLANLALDEKLWASYFQAVTPRTAGFNSLDIGSMNPATLTLTMFLMFIGAGSASTGSGIKLTTFIVIVLAVNAYLRGKKEAVIFKRSIPGQVVHRALAITVISLLMVITVIFLLTITEDAPYLHIIFEAFSAFGTVGLSMGLTAELSESGKLLLCILMLAGRIGPITLAFALARTSKGNIGYPKDDVFTG